MKKREKLAKEAIKKITDDGLANVAAREVGKHGNLPPQLAYTPPQRKTRGQKRQEITFQGGNSKKKQHKEGKSEVNQEEASEQDSNEPGESSERDVGNDEQEENEEEEEQESPAHRKIKPEPHPVQTTFLRLNAIAAFFDSKSIPSLSLELLMML